MTESYAVWRITFVVLVFLGQAAYSQKLSKVQAETIAISAVGDIMLGNDFPVNQLPPNGGAKIFQDVASYIRAADIRFGNFEGTLFDENPDLDAKTLGLNRHFFRTPTHMAPLLKEAGFNVMSVANNHTMDMGTKGFQSTVQVLEGLGILTASKYSNATIFEIRGIRVALIASDTIAGPRNALQPGSIFKEIAALKKKNDIVILSSHIGGEGVAFTRLTFQNEIYLGENRGNPVQFARDSIDAGADLVLFHGPHVPRAMEVYKNRLIAYSLGNFATMRGMSVQGPNGFSPVLRLQLAKSGEFLKGHIASFRQFRPDRVIYDKDANAFKMIRALSEDQFQNSAPAFAEDGFIAPSSRSN